MPSSTIRTVFITGANQGLSYHTVHQLAQTPHVLVFMGARRMSAAAAALAPDMHATSAVVPFYIDLGIPASITAASESVASALSTRGLPALGMLINNAAMGEGRPADILAINVAGTIAVKDAFLPLLAPGSGEIINVSGSIGSQNLYAGRPPLVRGPGASRTYCASKAALNNLTLQWAYEEEEKDSGIRVVAICPGYCATTMSLFVSTAMSPAVGCRVIVEEVLSSQGKSGVFFNKDGPLPW